MAVFDDLMALEFSPSNVSQRHEPPGPDLPLWRWFRVAVADAAKLQLCLKDATGRKVREAPTPSCCIGSLIWEH